MLENNERKRKDNKEDGRNSKNKLIYNHFLLHPSWRKIYIALLYYISDVPAHT